MPDPHPALLPRDRNIPALRQGPFPLPPDKGEQNSEFFSHTSTRSGPGTQDPVLSAPARASGLIREALTLPMFIYCSPLKRWVSGARGSPGHTPRLSASLPAAGPGCWVKRHQLVLSPDLQPLSNAASTKAGCSGPAPVRVS